MTPKSGVKYLVKAIAGLVCFRQPANGSGSSSVKAMCLGIVNNHRKKTVMISTAVNIINNQQLARIVQWIQIRYDMNLEQICTYINMSRNGWDCLSSHRLKGC